MLDHAFAHSNRPISCTGGRTSGAERFGQAPPGELHQRRRAVQGSRLIGYKRKTQRGVFPLLLIYALAVLLQLLFLHAL